MRALPGDVMDEAHRAGLVAAARELGGVDLPVNNASALDAEPLVRLEAPPLGGPGAHRRSMWPPRSGWPRRRRRR